MALDGVNSWDVQFVHEIELLIQYRVKKWLRMEFIVVEKNIYFDHRIAMPLDYSMFISRRH